MAGQFRPDEMEIDRNHLATIAGATLILGDVTGGRLETANVALRKSPNMQ
jgi:hypothetical protein